MDWLFWGIVGVIFYTYWGYPLLVSLVSLVRRRLVRSGACHPHVCFIVAAHNEEAVIEAKMRNTLSLRYPREDLHIIVASDGSTDSTNDLVRRFEDQGVELVACHPRQGKNSLLNHVIPRVHAEVIVISDANIELSPDGLEQLMRPFADPEVGGAWGDKTYRNPGESAAGEGESLYLRYEKFVKSRESRIGSIVAGECSCLAFRREMFEPLPLDIPDDFALSTNVVAKGKRMLYVPESHSFEDTSPTDRDEFRRKVRIIERGFRGFFRVLPLANPLRTGFYAVSLVTRQFLRRAVAVLHLAAIALLLMLAARGGVYAIVLWSVVAVLVLAALGVVVDGRWRRFPLVYVPYFFVLVNVAALAGMARCVVGARSIAWQPTGRGESIVKTKDPEA